MGTQAQGRTAWLGLCPRHSPKQGCPRAWQDQAQGASVPLEGQGRAPLACLPTCWPPGGMRQGLVSRGHRKERAEACVARRVGWVRQNPGPPGQGRVGEVGLVPESVYVRQREADRASLQGPPGCPPWPEDRSQGQQGRDSILSFPSPQHRAQGEEEPAPRLGIISKCGTLGWQPLCHPHPGYLEVSPDLPSPQNWFYLGILTSRPSGST